MRLWGSHWRMSRERPELHWRELTSCQWYSLECLPRCYLELRQERAWRYWRGSRWPTSRGLPVVHSRERLNCRGTKHYYLPGYLPQLEPELRRGARPQEWYCSGG